MVEWAAINASLADDCIMFFHKKSVTPGTPQERLIAPLSLPGAQHVTSSNQQDTFNPASVQGAMDEWAATNALPADSYRPSFHNRRGYSFSQPPNDEFSGFNENSISPSPMLNDLDSGDAVDDLLADEEEDLDNEDSKEDNKDDDNENYTYSAAVDAANTYSARARVEPGLGSSHPTDIWIFQK